MGLPFTLGSHKGKLRNIYKLDSNGCLVLHFASLQSTPIEGSEGGMTHDPLHLMDTLFVAGRVILINV